MNKGILNEIENMKDDINFLKANIGTFYNWLSKLENEINELKKKKK